MTTENNNSKTNAADKKKNKNGVFFKSGVLFETPVINIVISSFWNRVSTFDIPSNV